MITKTNKYEIELHNSQLDIFKTNFDELKYSELFIEFAELCSKFENTDRFGLCLRHKHFDLKRGEVSMREILKDGIDLFPSILKNTTNVYPYILVLHNDEVKVVEYVHCEDEDLTLNETDYEFFNDVFSLLKKYKLEQTLGIQQLVSINRVNYGPGKMLVESSHETKKRYEMTRVRETSDSTEIINTLWVSSKNPLMGCTPYSGCFKNIFQIHIYKEKHKSS